MEELELKVLGANIEHVLPNTKKYFRVVVITNTGADYPLLDYLRNSTSNFCKQYQEKGAFIDCDNYVNISYGISLFYFLAEVPEGSDYNDKDFETSEASALMVDVKDILANQDPNDHPFLHVFNYSDNKDDVISKLTAIRKDVVFKSDLYAGKILNDIIADLPILFDVNKQVDPDLSLGEIDYDKETEGASKPLATYIIERENVIKDIMAKVDDIKVLKLKKKRLNDAIVALGGTAILDLEEMKELEREKQEEEARLKAEAEAKEKEVSKEPEENPESHGDTNGDITEPPKAPTNVSTVERTPEQVEKEDRTVAEVNKILDGLDIDLTSSETSEKKEEIKEKIEEETPVVNAILNNTDIPTEVPDKKDVTKETLLKPEPKETEPDNISKDETTIYDKNDQKRNLDEYITNLISSDSEFEGDWDDEQNLFQVAISNDNKVRSELTKDEYKEYLDIVTRYSLNKNDKTELSTGVYSLRKAKFDNIGSYEYAND